MKIEPGIADGAARGGHAFADHQAAGDEEHGPEDPGAGGLADTDTEHDA